MKARVLRVPLLILGVLAIGCAVPEEPTASLPGPADGPPAGWPTGVPRCDDFVEWDDSTWGCAWGWTADDLCPEYAVLNPLLDPQEGDFCPAMTAWLEDPAEGWAPAPGRSLAALSPSLAVNSLELRLAYGKDEVGPVESWGTPCRTASDARACLEEYAELLTQLRGRFFPDFTDGSTMSLIYTRGDEVGELRDSKDLLEFLRPLTLSDASYWLESHTTWEFFRTRRIRERDSEMELVSTYYLSSSLGRRDRVALRIKPGGAVCVFAAAVESAPCYDFF